MPQQQAAAPSAKLNDAVRAAAARGHTDLLLQLIDAGATCDADKEGRTALHFAAHYGHSDTVAALVLAGCDVNAPDFSGHTALQRAAAEGHVDIVEQLIKRGARIDHQDDIHGNAALHEAAWKGFSETLELLCKAKANAYIKNKGGFAALHLACQNGHNQSCRVLLLAGCRADIKNNYGDTPLHTAARYGHAGVLRILISGNCDVREQNKNGDTALHISAAMGRRKLTRILLETGGCHTLHNKQGETATDIARRKNFSEVLDMLLRAKPTPVGASNGHAGRHATDAAATRSAASSRKEQKKREKESGTSKDSRDSGSRHKDKHKKSKRVHGRRGAVPDGNLNAKEQHHSPYGCHYFPNMTSFPAPNLDSLPHEPLKKDEQYYLDLAGNIRKGPVGMGYACYCVPFFQRVEKKMDRDKAELKGHIDSAHQQLDARLDAKMDARIGHLERRTRSQLQHMHRGLCERMAADKAECFERVERTALRERGHQEQARRQHDQTLRHQLHDWLREQQPPPPAAGNTQPDSQLRQQHLESESEDESDSEDETRSQPRLLDNTVTRSRSEETIADGWRPQVTNATSERPAGLQVLSPLRRRGRSQDGQLHDIDAIVAPEWQRRQLQEERSDTNGRLVAGASGNVGLPRYLQNGSAHMQQHQLYSHAHARIPNGHASGNGRLAATDTQLRQQQQREEVEISGGAGHNDSQDHDSGYTTKLHSSFESHHSVAGTRVQQQPQQQQPPLPGPKPPTILDRQLRQLAAEFRDTGGGGSVGGVESDPVFDSVLASETDKWEERRRAAVSRTNLAPAPVSVSYPRINSPLPPAPAHVKQAVMASRQLRTAPGSVIAQHATRNASSLV